MNCRTPCSGLEAYRPRAIEWRPASKSLYGTTTASMPDRCLETSPSKPSRSPLDNGLLIDALNPNHPFAFLQRGRLKTKLGDYGAALTDFSAHMEVSSN